MAAKTVLVVHDDADLVGSLRAALAEQSPDIELVNALSGPACLGDDGAGGARRARGRRRARRGRRLRLRPTGQDGARDRSGAHHHRVARSQRGLGAQGATGRGGRRICRRPVLSDPLVAKIVTLASTAQPAAAPAAVNPPPTPRSAGRRCRCPGFGLRSHRRAIHGGSCRSNRTTALPSPSPRRRATRPSPRRWRLRSLLPRPAVASESGPPGGNVPHIDDLLRLMLERGGSDLHITVGSPPGIRQRGELLPVEDMRAALAARHAWR